jgi:Surface-adhesin protein E
MRLLNVIISVIFLFFHITCSANSDCPEGEIRFSFQNIEVTKAFALFGDYTGKTVIIDEFIDKSEPMNFDCTPWKSIAKTLADKHQLTLNINDKTIYVSASEILEEDLILINSEYGDMVYVVNSSIYRKSDEVEFDYILDVLLAYENFRLEKKYKSNKVHGVINCKADTFSFRGLEAYDKRAGNGVKVANYYGTDNDRKSRKIEKKSTARDIYKYLCKG